MINNIDFSGFDKDEILRRIFTKDLTQFTTLNCGEEIYDKIVDGNDLLKYGLYSPKAIFKNIGCETNEVVGVLSNPVLEKMIIFTEHNENEGETWHFYMNYDDGLLTLLYDISGGDDLTYTIGTGHYHRDTLLNLSNDDGFYIGPLNHVYLGDIDHKVLEKEMVEFGVDFSDIDYEMVEEYLYKGTIMEFVGR